MVELQDSQEAMQLYGAGRSFTGQDASDGARSEPCEHGDLLCAPALRLHSCGQYRAERGVKVLGRQPSEVHPARVTSTAPP